MKNTSKIQQYLKGKGVDETTEKSVVDNLKKEFWKKERIKSNKENRANKKDVRFSLSLAEWLVIEKEASEHNMSVTTYARKTLRAYKERVFIPPNISALEELSSLVGSISNNINTAMQYMHLTRNYGESDNGLGKMRKELNILFRLLTESVEDKPDLYHWLQNDLEKYPERVERVHIILENLQTDASS